MTAGGTQCAFFDLDGCLVDSRAAISRSINHALATVGVAVQPPEALYRYIGPPLLEVFTALLAEVGADSTLAGACIEAYRADYADASLALTTPVPGMRDVLEDLAGRFPLAVVTSKPGRFAEPILARVDLADHFAGVFAPSLDVRAEAKTATLRRALEGVRTRVPLEPSSTWMVGDRWHDVAAGKACGTRTAAVTWGIGDKAELAAAGPDATVARPPELIGVLA